MPATQDRSVTNKYIYDAADQLLPACRVSYIPDPLSCARHDRPSLVTDLLSPRSLSDLLMLEPAQFDRAEIGLADVLCAEGLPGAEAVSLTDMLQAFETWASRVSSQTERNLYRYRANPKEFENSEAYFRMLIMAAVVYDDFRVRYNPERISMPTETESGDHFFADPQDIFLHGLLGSRRMGTCSSMPVLYIALGRRLGYPLKLVATKSHLFIRWESDTERFNVECTGRGMNRYDDAHFKQWPFPVTDDEIKADGYLKSMTPAEELAVFLSLRGHCLKANGRLPEAITAYAQAARLAPHSRAYRLLLADAQSKLSPQPARPVAAVPYDSQFQRSAFPISALPAEAPPDPNPLLKIR